MYALDGKTGDTSWIFRTAQETASSYSHPIQAVSADSGNIYVSANSFCKIRASDIRILWTKEPDTWSSSSGRANMVVSEQRVYVQLNGYEISALQSDDGKLVWNRSLDSVASPVLAGDHIYAADGSALFALRTQDGGVAWSSSDPFLNSLSAGAGVVCAADAYEGNVIARRTSDGKELWRYSTGRAPGPVISDGIAYVPAKNTLEAVNADDGSPIWSFKVRADRQPIVTDNSVYVSNGETLYAIAIAFGQERWSFRIPTTSNLPVIPVVANGMAYLSTASGSAVDIYALRA
jgi:outer membrane protein assembly factor BamB